jgi:hypothetical protein
MNLLLKKFKKTAVVGAGVGFIELIFLGKYGGLRPTPLKRPVSVFAVRIAEKD